MQTLLQISRWIDVFNEKIGKSAAWLGLLAVLVCTGNALARYVFSQASNAWLELQWYFNSAVFLLIAGYALRRNEHVRIDVINSRLSQRTRAWIDIVGGLFFLMPAALIIAWFAWPTLVISWNIQEFSSDPGGLIRWPVRLLIPVAFVMLLLQGFSEVIKRVACLRGLLPWSVLDTKVAHGAVPDQDEVAYELKAEAR